MVLRTDPRLILPLFSETRTHNLSSGIGLAGPIQIMSWAHESGQFLVVENDLTRCLGIGDLTVVRSNDRWMHPLPIEIKSKGEFREGAVVEVDMITAFSDHPLDKELFEEFSRLLELKERTNPKTTPKIEQQAREIQERTELLLQVTRDARDMLRAGHSLWTALENILAKAQHGGHAYDAVEDGLAFVSVRTRPEDDAAATTRRVLRLLDEIGFGGGKGYRVTTSHNFRMIDWISAIAPPISLWPIRAAIRTDLLVEDLFFACITAPTLWERAFEAHGIEWRDDGDRWILAHGGKQIFIDLIEVQKLTVGVALAGFSPKEIAAAVARDLSS